MGGGHLGEVPGFGFLRDVFPDPFKVSWDIADGWATSPDLPGVRVPGSPFMGTIGLTRGRRLLAETAAREQALLERGGSVPPPSPASAVPDDPRIAAEALRTIPPREQAGNVDIKQHMIEHLTERGWTRGHRALTVEKGSWRV